MKKPNEEMNKPTKEQMEAAEVLPKELKKQAAVMALMGITGTVGPKQTAVVVLELLECVGNLTLDVNNLKARADAEDAIANAQEKQE